MGYAIRFSAPGGPEVLQPASISLLDPPAGWVRLRHQAVGLNYIDVYHRSGLYALPLPSGIGLEGAGVVEAVGEGVSDFAPGDRVAYAGGPLGAYAQERNFPAERLLHLPDSISFEQAAAVMLQGLTAQFLLHRTYPLRPGDTLLIHAAAGGVGLLVCQWAKALGATVIGTVGSEEKAILARDNGCDHAIVYTRDNFVEAVRELTAGEGVAVVYDSVGRQTFDASLDCLRPLGMMVLFGAASGAVPPMDVSTLAHKGSLFLTRPSLFTYCAKREDLLAMTEALFAAIAKGVVHVRIGQRYKLLEAAQAHRDLEARRTQGATVLLP